MRLIHHVCLVHITTANLDLSKRQYENNFQKDNPAEREAAGTKARTEKVIVLKSGENENALTDTWIKSQSVTNSPDSLGEPKGESSRQKKIAEKTEDQQMQPSVLRKKLLARQRLVFRADQRLDPSRRGKAVDQVRLGSVMIRG